MNTRYRTSLVLSIAALIAAGLSGCRQEAEITGDLAPPAEQVAADAMPPEPADTPPGDMGDDTGVSELADTGPTALDVTSIALGSEIGPEGNVVLQDTFSADDDIVVEIDTGGAASAAEIQARLVAATGETLAEQAETVSTTGVHTTTLVFRNPALAAGDYTVEVWINGSKADSTGLTVE